MIACALAKGDTQMAAEQLNAYLKIFPSDVSAVREGQVKIAFVPLFTIASHISLAVATIG